MNIVLPDGSKKELADGSTVADVAASIGAGLAKAALAGIVNDQPVDLSAPVAEGDSVAIVTAKSDEGLELLRHSTAHVMAAALVDLYGDVQFGVGPAIEDGFYYDVKLDRALSPDDFAAIEARMAEIVKADEAFERRVVTRAEAEEIFASQPFKLELIAELPEDAVITTYTIGKFTDLCRGPHLPSTKLIGQGFALTKSSSAYWKGDQHGDSLQRIYGTAWASKEDLKAYQTRLAEAAKRDHRKLGAELDLFSFPEEIGPGLVVFHPKGGMLRHEIEKYVIERHERAGFDFVHTPEITKAGLFHTSGHLPYYADTMFPPMLADEETDAEGNVTKAGQEYYLKAMNCPMHNLIFRSRGRSYRELPLRLFEMGHDYRYEKSGVVHGLTRMRGFTQDDSHTYCTREQAPEEIKKQIEFFISILKAFGLTDFYLELSTRDEDGAKKDKFIGSDEDWEAATRTLSQVCASTGLDLVPDPGGAAFYGPKVSVQVKDAIGRTWQMSTIQYDFNQPERFDLEYTAADGSHQRPIMLHSAKLGSVERFIGVLTEHYAGAFPAWLAPVQVRLIPVAEAFDDYVTQVAARLRERGVRVETDLSDDRFGKKIRNASKEKVPFTLIAGGEDAEAGAVSFRFRDGEQTNGVPVDEAIEHIADVIARKVNDPAGEKLAR